MSALSNIFRKLAGTDSVGPGSEPQSVKEQRNSPHDGAPRTEEFLFDGFNGGRVQTKYVEFLSDENLQALNALLPWKCFTVDSKGRRFGDRAWPGKRETPQPVPDPRIVGLN
ncbi:MAG: hypothetical protein ACREXR_12355, partial [Gammaproteobacteria bacterium]